MTTLSLRGVTAGYDGTDVIHDVTVDLASGERLVVLGPNGAGKSTLVKVIAGGLRISAGQLNLDATELTRASVRRRTQAGIRWVGEPRPVYSEMTVLDNLLVGGYINRRSSRALDHVYELFPDLTHHRHDKVGRLSGGQQQMVAIGQALMSKPQFLCLDEPSTGLALGLVDRLAATIDALAADGTGVIWCEQFPEVALAHCDKVAIMTAGYLEEPMLPELLTEERLHDAYVGSR
jgi:branched-chain amino acid transport system ATP-binding protein